MANLAAAPRAPLPTGLTSFFAGATPLHAAAAACRVGALRALAPLLLCCAEPVAPAACAALPAVRAVCAHGGPSAALFPTLSHCCARGRTPLLSLGTSSGSAPGPRCRAPCDNVAQAPAAATLAAIAAATAAETLHCARDGQRDCAQPGGLMARAAGGLTLLHRLCYHADEALAGELLAAAALAQTGSVTEAESTAGAALSQHVYALWRGEEGSTATVASTAALERCALVALLTGAPLSSWSPVDVGDAWFRNQRLSTSPLTAAGAWSGASAALLSTTAGLDQRAPLHLAAAAGSFGLVLLAQDVARATISVATHKGTLAVAPATSASSVLMNALAAQDGFALSPGAIAQMHANVARACAVPGADGSALRALRAARAKGLYARHVCGDGETFAVLYAKSRRNHVRDGENGTSSRDHQTLNTEPLQCMRELLENHLAAPVPANGASPLTEQERLALLPTAALTVGMVLTDTTVD